MPLWAVTLRKDGQEVEDGARFASFSGELVVNDSGTWSLDYDLRHPVAVELQAGLALGVDIKRYGIVVRPDGQTAPVFSGPILSVFVADGQASGYEQETLRITGTTDFERLRWRVAFPNPAADIGTSAATVGASYDSRSGPAETVLLGYLAANLGSSALTRRQMTQAQGSDATVFVPGSAGRGTSISLDARFQTLHELAQTCARTGNINVALVQSAANTVSVNVTTPALRAGVVFGVEQATVTGSVLSLAVAQANSVLAGGSGDLASRTFQRVENRPAFTALQEALYDGNDSAGLATAGGNRLAELGPRYGVTIDASAASPFTPGVDYNVGDYVIFSRGSGSNALSLQLVVNKVAFAASNADTEMTFTPSIDTGNEDKLFELLRRTLATTRTR